MRPSYYCRPWFTRAAAAMNAPTPPRRAASSCSTSLSGRARRVARLHRLVACGERGRLQRLADRYPAPVQHSADTALPCCSAARGVLPDRLQTTCTQAYTYINRTSHFVKNICSGRTHGRLQTVQRDGCVHAGNGQRLIGHELRACLTRKPGTRASVTATQPSAAASVAEAAVAPGCELHDGSGPARRSPRPASWPRPPARWASWPALPRRRTRLLLLLARHGLMESDASLLA